MPVLSLPISRVDVDHKLKDLARINLIPKLKLLLVWLRSIRFIQILLSARYFDLYRSTTTSTFHIRRTPTNIPRPILNVSRTRADFTFPEYPTPTGRKKALLVACTYLGCKDEGMHLKNSWRDVMRLEKLLLKKGWLQDDIVVLVDQGENKELYPTIDNIHKHMAALVDGARDGDFLVMHFSGHGGQTKAIDDKFEVDGMDEYILTCDYDKDEHGCLCILDDDFRRILVDPLPIGCRLLGLIDCCSAGTMFDLPNEDPFEEHPKPVNCPLMSSQPRHIKQKRSSTFPLYRQHQQFMLQNIGPRVPASSKHPRMLPRHIYHVRGETRDDIDIHNDKAAASVEIDTRTILGDVICIAACHDGSQAYETPEGGILIQAFCKIFEEAEPNSLTLGDLYASLKNNLRLQHEKGCLKENLDPEKHKAPVPQLTFSRHYVAKEAIFEL